MEEMINKVNLIDTKEESNCIKDLIVESVKKVKDPFEMLSVEDVMKDIGICYSTAYDLFNQAYDLYCLFWGLNMKMLDVSDVKWVEDNLEDIKKISEKLEEHKAPVKKKEVKK